jgi:hypothetical protein
MIEAGPRGGALVTTWTPGGLEQMFLELGRLPVGQHHGSAGPTADRPAIRFGAGLERQAVTRPAPRTRPGSCRVRDAKDVVEPGLGVERGCDDTCPAKNRRRAHRWGSLDPDTYARAEALSDCEKTRDLRGLRLERLPVPHSAGRAIQGPPAPSPSAQAVPPGGHTWKRGVKKAGLHDRAAPFLLRSRAEWTRIPIPERRGFLPVSIVAGPWIHRSRFPLV